MFPATLAWKFFLLLSFKGEGTHSLFLATAVPENSLLLPRFFNPTSSCKKKGGGKREITNGFRQTAPREKKLRPYFSA